MAPRTLLVVDGNSLAHRAFHGYPTGTTAPDGTDVSAIAGFASLLAGVAGKVRPDAVVIGFDDPDASWRREEYPDYKGTRERKDPRLVSTLAKLPRVLTAAGLTVIAPAGGEADDVLGAAATIAGQAGWRTVLATSDRDAVACIRDGVTLLRLRDGLDKAEVIDTANVVDVFGVPAHLYRDFAAVRGDTSDNLPGIAGFGPKRAADLINAAGGAEAALVAAAADPGAWASIVGKGYAARIADPEAAERVRRNLHLMTIATTLPELDGFTPDDAICRHAPERMRNAFTEIGLGASGSKLAAALADPKRAQMLSTRNDRAPRTADDTTDGATDAGDDRVRATPVPAGFTTDPFAGTPAPAGTGHQPPARATGSAPATASSAPSNGTAAIHDGRSANVRSVPLPLISRVNGATFWQDNLAGIVDGQAVYVVHEPDNAEDVTAMAVYTQGGAKLGYLPRALAVRVLQHGTALSGHVAEVQRMPGVGLYIDVRIVAPCSIPAFSPLARLREAPPVDPDMPAADATDVVDGADTVASRPAPRSRRTSRAGREQPAAAIMAPRAPVAHAIVTSGDPRIGAQATSPSGRVLGTITGVDGDYLLVDGDTGPSRWPSAIVRIAAVA